MDFDIAPDTRAATVRAREAYARDILNPYVIALRIKAAALQGSLSVQVTQDKPVDLADTLQAQATIKLLTDLHYDTDWVEVRRIEAGPRGLPAREFHYKELVVSWHHRALAN
jgi:hypothetical protein